MFKEKPTHGEICLQDKQAIMRAVYYMKTYRQQKEFGANVGTTFRIRVVTKCPKETAILFASQFYNEDLLGDEIKFLSWDQPVFCFAGRCEDFIITSGLGGMDKFTELWARLRDPTEGTAFAKWGRSLEVIA